MTGSEASTDDLLLTWQDVSITVGRAQRRIDQVLEDAGIPAHWYAVLHQLLHAEDHRMPMSALARDVSMTSGGFTKLADRMARDGLIDRRGSAVDRRVINATLTGDGLGMARRADQLYRDAVSEVVLLIVDPQDLRAAAGALRTLREALSATHRPEDTVLVTSVRDPALPDRRGRGRSD